MRLAIGGACVLLLLLLTAFNPLLALAAAGGLLLGLAGRRLWRSRDAVRRRWSLWLGLGTLAAVLIFYVVAQSSARYPTAPPPPVTITPRYEGTAEYSGGAWKLTNRVIFSSDSILKLSDLSAPPIADEVVDQLTQDLEPRGFTVLPLSDYVEIDPAPDTSPKLFKAVVDKLKRNSSAGRWSVDVNEAFGRKILLSPSLRSTPDQGRSRASQSLITQLESQGWRARQVNDVLVFSHNRQEEARIRWFPATTSHQLQIILPHYITLQNGREVLFAPDEGSQLTLYTKSHLVASTLPTA